MVLCRGLMEQERLPVVLPGCSSPDTMQEFILKGKAALLSVGIIRDSVIGNGKDSGKISGRIIDSDMHDVGRFLNRLLGLPPDIQNRLFELFVSILDLIIQNACVEGHLDSGIVDMEANTIELQGTPKTVHVDSMSGASTVLFTFTLDRGMTWESASTLLVEKQKGESTSSNNGFYESRREWMGKWHFMLAFENVASGMYKIYRPTIGESIREMPLAELKDKYRKISALERAQKGWEDEYEVSSKLCMHGPKCKLGNFCTVGRRIQEVNILGGSFFLFGEPLKRHFPSRPAKATSGSGLCVLRPPQKVNELLVCLSRMQQLDLCFKIFPGFRTSEQHESLILPVFDVRS